MIERRMIRVMNRQTKMIWRVQDEVSKKYKKLGRGWRNESEELLPETRWCVEIRFTKMRITTVMWLC